MPNCVRQQSLRSVKTVRLSSDRLLLLASLIFHLVSRDRVQSFLLHSAAPLCSLFSAPYFYLPLIERHVCVVLWLIHQPVAHAHDRTLIIAISVTVAQSGNMASVTTNWYTLPALPLFAARRAARLISGPDLFGGLLFRLNCSAFCRLPLSDSPPLPALVVFQGSISSRCSITCRLNLRFYL